jgi:hypothetical protein
MVDTETGEFIERTLAHEGDAGRGKVRQSGETHAGMLDFNSGPALQ